jgi:hypothetical protein
LRAKQNKRYDGNRRQYPNSQYQDRRGGKDNRKQQFAVASAVETLSTALTENLPALKTILENISVNQEKLARAEERRAKAEERKAAALESIVEYAGKLVGSGLNLPLVGKVDLKSEISPKVDVEQDFVETEVDVEIEEACEKNEDDEFSEDFTRDDILNMICGLREEGLTYDQIAKQLEDESVPTFSGKGKWRGQTIHRLYQKMTS